MWTDSSPTEKLVDKINESNDSYSDNNDDDSSSCEEAELHPNFRSTFMQSN